MYICMPQSQYRHMSVNPKVLMNWRNEYGKEIDFEAVCDMEYGGRHANGRLKLPNGLIYTGNFEDFAPDGHGTLTNGNTGEVLYDGDWHHGHRYAGDQAYGFCMYQ